MRRVSVVIPTYNCGARLLCALQSIAAQSYASGDIEVLVIDDGSTDDTAELVAHYSADSKLELRYVRQHNAGPAAARNHGLCLARGDAIAFLDADDIWLPAKLEKQMALLTGRVGLVYCGNSYVDAHGQPIQSYVRHVAIHRGDILLPLFCDFFLLTSAVVLSRAAVNVCGEFNEELAVGEDYEYFLRVARRFDADCVEEELLVRCVRPDSLSRRDYALDARVDLATLSAFVRANPKFARAHRAAIKRRFARYRYEFAWRLLADNRRDEAAAELLRSLREHASLAAARTLARTLLPLPASG